MKLTREQWRERTKNRRKHEHFRVLVTYVDNEQSAKVFPNKERAEKFAARQKKSPVVKSAKITKLD